MDNQDELKGLILKLQRLKIEGDQIRAEEQTVLKRLSVLVATKDSKDTKRTSIPTNVIPTEGDSVPFEIGEHVYIKNKIRHVPSSRRINRKDRASVVDRIINEKVYITTYNGSSTWRHHKNLNSLTLSEQKNIRENP